MWSTTYSSAMRVGVSQHERPNQTRTTTRLQHPVERAYSNPKKARMQACPHALFFPSAASLSITSNNPLPNLSNCSNATSNPFPPP
jgi:hypothetical protein